ncbi:exported hypothetical protein [Tenacibaculum litopenaei]|uniref:lipocalin family protein n=1 Tax=Tenacibaculum litopenaei TaxID=396016 RepID=UPI0038942412
MNKTTLGLLSLCFLYFSCITVNCCGPDEPYEPLLGTWYRESKNGVQYDDCLKKDELVFTKDGRIRFTLHEKTPNGCIQKEIKNGKWRKKATNTYGLTYGSQPEKIEKISFDDGFILIFDATREVFLQKNTY